MGFNFADAKRNARIATRDTLSVAFSYQDSAMVVPEAILGRWHPKVVRHGDLMGEGYANEFEGTDRVILDKDTARQYGVKRGATITLPEQYGSLRLRLDVQLPDTGPIEESWIVIRL